MVTRSTAIIVWISIATAILAALMAALTGNVEGLLGWTTSALWAGMALWIAKKARR